MTYLKTSGKRIDDLEVKRLYEVEKKSVIEIAGLLNCSYHTVLRSLKRSTGRKSVENGWHR